MVRVYIASPFTIGDQELNVMRSMEYYDRLMEEGFLPFSPLGHTYISFYEGDYEEWMKVGFEWLKVCHALLRLKGESPGADREVECARDNGIPVFYTIEQLKEYYHDSA